IMEFSIREYREGDLESILRIQRAAHYASTWVARDYQHLAADRNGLVVVAQVEPARPVVAPLASGERPDRTEPAKVVGFAAFCRVYYDEAELWNVAVLPECQRRGVATALLKHGFESLGRVGIRKIFLEVRASNAPALALYRVLGFSLQSQRKKYYHNPP